MARSNARAIRTQKKSLDFPFWVVLDNHVALDYLLDAQEGVCAITNTSCCTWIYTSHQVELETSKLFKLPKSLKGTHSPGITSWVNLRFPYLFSWLPTGMETILRKGLQIILLIVLLICSFLVLVQLLTLCLSQCSTMIQETKIIAQQLLTEGQA